MTNKTIDLYLLPGTMCDQRVWQQVIDRLPPHVVCHYVDLPLGENIDDIVSQLANQLPVEGVNLAGFSLGGYVAAHFAISYPARLKQLMILANSPTTLPPFEIKMRQVALLMAKKMGYGGILTAKIKQLLAPSNRAEQHIIDLIKAMDSSGGEQKFISQISATTNREDLTAALTQLNIPLRFVFGDSDCLVNKALLWALNEPGIQTVELTDCGHMSLLEQPSAVTEQLVDFYREP